MNFSVLIQNIIMDLEIRFFTEGDHTWEKYNNIVTKSIEDHLTVEENIKDATGGRFTSLRDFFELSRAFEYLNNKSEHPLDALVREANFVLDEAKERKKIREEKLLKDIQIIRPLYEEMFPENVDVVIDVLENKNKARIPDLMNKSVMAKIGKVQDAQVCAMAMMNRCSTLFAGLDLSKFADLDLSKFAD